MKKILIALLLSYSGVSWGANNCVTNPTLTGSCGPTTTYKITVLEVALCRDAACASEYIVGSGAKTFDIASAAVGASIGSYASFDTIPPGTYTHMRSVISRNFDIVAAAVAPCAGQNGVLPLVNGSEGKGDAITAANLPGLTWKDAAKTQIQSIGALTSPITITQGGKPPTVAIKFGTQTSYGCYTGPGGPFALAQPPEMSVTITP